MTFSRTPGLHAFGEPLTEVKIEITVSGNSKRTNELLKHLIGENRLGARIPLSIPIPGFVDLRSAWVSNVEISHAIDHDPLSLEITLMGSEQEAS